MKICGILLRVLAVLAAVVLCVVVIINGSLQLESIEDSRDDLAEEIEEHEEDIENPYEDYYYEHDSSECSTCEYHEDREKSLDRSETSLILSIIQTLMIYAVVFSGMLFALGAILSKMGCANAPTAAPAATPVPVAEPVVIPAPVSNVCPNCGTPKQSGSRFCGTCGTFFNY